MKKILVALLTMFCFVGTFGQSYLPGKLTVILREQALQGMVRHANGTATLPNAASFNALAQLHGLVAARPMSPKPNSAFRKFFELQFPANANLENIRGALGNNPLVEWVSPIPATLPEPLGPFIPDDLYMQSPNSRYLNQASDVADINAPEAWEWALGNPNVVIAICGGGINWITPGYHQSADVAANLWTNPGEIAGNGIDDDGNGYVDDIHGWNFYAYTGHPIGDNDIEYTHTPYTLPPDYLLPDPLWWHGTPMASHAASAIDNCTAVHCGVGVAPQCKIMGVPHYSGESIVYAADNGAKVLAYGFGIPASYLSQFVTYAFNAGMIVVNGGGNALPYGPYDFPPYGISVAALDANNVPVTIIDPVIKIAAPARYTQTSWATPVVAGVVALMRSINPYLTAGEVRSVLLSTKSTNPVNVTGVGAGRVDAFKAISNATASPKLNSISGNWGEHPVLKWDPNATLSTFPVDQFVVQRKRHYLDETYFQDIAALPVSSTTYVDPVELVGRLLGEHSPPTEYRVRARLNYSGSYILSVPSNMLSIWTHSNAGGSGGATEKSTAGVSLPTETRLLGNYPNPFNPSTTIGFSLSDQYLVTLKVFDILGREVATVLNKNVLSPGEHNIVFDASALPSGVYVYRLEAGQYSATKRLVLLK